jgi:hypothetical protein
VALALSRSLDAALPPVLLPPTTKLMALRRLLPDLPRLLPCVDRSALMAFTVGDVGREAFEVRESASLLPAVVALFPLSRRVRKDRSVDILLVWRRVELARWAFEAAVGGIVAAVTELRFERLVAAVSVLLSCCCAGIEAGTSDASSRCC